MSVKTAYRGWDVRCGVDVPKEDGFFINGFSEYGNYRTLRLGRFFISIGSVKTLRDDQKEN